EAEVTRVDRDEKRREGRERSGGRGGRVRGKTAPLVTCLGLEGTVAGPGDSRGCGGVVLDGCHNPPAVADGWHRLLPVGGQHGDHDRLVSLRPDTAAQRKVAVECRTRRIRLERARRPRHSERATRTVADVARRRNIGRHPQELDCGWTGIPYDGLAAGT